MKVFAFTVISFVLILAISYRFKTRSSAMTEGLCDALVSKNLATTNHLI